MLLLSNEIKLKYYKTVLLDEKLQLELFPWQLTEINLSWKAKITNKKIMIKTIKKYKAHKIIKTKSSTKKDVKIKANLKQL